MREAIKSLSLLDMIEARLHLEVAVAGLAAERADDQAVEQLRACFEAMCAAGEDIPRYVEADVAFHLQVARMSGNEVFANLFTSLRALLGAWAHRVQEHAGETASSLAGHEPIVEAIAARDVEWARAAMTTHMESARRRLRDAVAAHGDGARYEERLSVGSAHGRD